MRARRRRRTCGRRRRSGRARRRSCARPARRERDLAVGGRATAALCVTSTTARAGLARGRAAGRAIALGRCRVELAGRLVGQQHRRVVRERDREPGAGELAAGQLRGPRVGALRRARRRRATSARRATAGAAGEPLGERDVLARRRGGRAGWRSGRACRSSRPAAVRARSSGRRDIRSPAIAHHAAVGLVEPGQAGEQRRLARPDGPVTATISPALDAQRHAAQRERLVVARVEEAVEARGLEDRASSRPPQRVGDDPPRVDVVGTLRRLRVSTASAPAVAELVALDVVDDRLAR